MKTTEQTTLGELAQYLTVLGDPFVTLMVGLDGYKHVVVNLTGERKGMFIGAGTTVAEALEAAFTSLRLAFLPEPLKAMLVDRCPSCGQPTHASEADDTGLCSACSGKEHDDYDRATGDLGRPLLKGRNDP